MRGNKNGVRPPCRIIPRKKLEHDIKRGLRKCHLLKKYGISERLLHRNLEYHNMPSALGDNKKLPYCVIEDFDLITKLEAFHPGLTSLIERTDYRSKEHFKELRKVQRDIMLSLLYLNDLGKRQARKHNIIGVSFSLNVAELYVEAVLHDLRVEFTRNFPLRFRNKTFRFDFLIPSKNLLIEIDGSIHRRSVTPQQRKAQVSKDALRGRAAKAKGYELRIIKRLSRKTLYYLDEEVKNVIS